MSVGFFVFVKNRYAAFAPMGATSGSGPWLHTYAEKRGAASARLPREITIPIGSSSDSA